MKNKFLKLLAWVAWFLVVYYGVVFTAGAILQLVVGKDNLINLANDAVFGTVFSSIIFVIMLICFWYIPNKFFKQKITLESVGFSDFPTWSDLGFGVIGFIVAMFLASGLTHLLQPILNFDPNQQQNVGFLNVRESYQYVLAFVSLVVITPIAEELIFRGVLYGEMRKTNPIIAGIVVSVLFGLAHGQMNVAIVTFAMSLVMCFMREKLTDSIWSSIFLHMIKNGLAFYILFIAPNLIYAL